VIVTPPAAAVPGIETDEVAEVALVDEDVDREADAEVAEADEEDITVKVGSYL